MRTLVKLLAGLAAPAILAGCVAGQSLQTDYVAPEATAPLDGTSILLTVSEDRPYVKSGDKPPYYIGKYRAGFGNPWDVTTDNNEPLVDIMKRDMTEELIALGHPVKEAAPTDREMTISIRDWNFDGYQNGQFWYDVLVTVKSPTGEVLANSIVTDKVGITGSFWEGAKGGFERDMPKLYAEAIRKMVRENEAVTAALAKP
jgi:hypothetical protein